MYGFLGSTNNVLKSKRLLFMDHDTIQKLLELNKRSYSAIANDFSQTRHSLWRDFAYFKPYLKAPLNVLDFGCGNGRLIEFLRPFFGEYTGIDSSMELLDHAKKKFGDEKKVFFNNDDITKFSCEKYTDYFDSVFLIAVLHHIPCKKLQREVLLNAYKMLVPGGYLFLTNWNLWVPSLKQKTVYRSFLDRFLKEYRSWYTEKGVRLRLRDVITWWKKSENQQPLYYYAFKKNEIANLCREAGFEVVENRYSQDHWYRAGNIVTCARKKI